jgi:hypothetical protein
MPKAAHGVVHAKAQFPAHTDTPEHATHALFAEGYDPAEIDRSKLSTRTSPNGGRHVPPGASSGIVGKVHRASRHGSVSDESRGITGGKDLGVGRKLQILVRLDAAVCRAFDSVA